jgi:hypothetical protein
VDAGCKSLISICFSKIAGAPLGSLKFLGSKEESMACALRRYGVTDSGSKFIYIFPESVTPSVDTGCKRLMSICCSKIAVHP